MKEAIREFVLDLGADDVGFGSVSAYRSPMSPPVETIFPRARSFVVMAYRELSSCESGSPHLAMNGRLDLMEFSRSCNYRLARFLERKHGARAMSVPVSYPMEMSRRTKGTVGEFSLRHAAVASGLGAFAGASPEERKAMLKDEGFWAMYQANFIGLQYFCFNCLTSCPVGRLEVAAAT